MQASSDMSELGEACLRWQTGRDGGSSLLRGAARVLTAIPHYFSAGFIEAYEDRARADPSALRDARVLLGALEGSMTRDPSSWAAHLKLGLGDPFAGRGLEPKSQDDQIAAQLASGTIDMPLWGVSLNRTIADSYGTRFLFELAGPFPAIAAWTYSGIKAEELELITGGKYAVHKVEDQGATTHVKLAWTAPLLVDTRPANLHG